MLPFGKPMLGDEERAAVAEVLAGTTLTHGPRVKEFEASFAEFTGAPHAIATATCMASLHLAYLFLEVGPGDEVIVPAQTHVAMAHAVQACGAKPVFIDSEPRTGGIDLDQLDSLITPRTRAISVVHYLGLPVDIERVLEIARRHDCFVVEDCAIALGATYGGTHVGLHGDIGCFSFYPVKHITTGEGGMVITQRDDVAERVSKQRAFGIDKNVLADRRHTGAYEIEYLGLNYRLGEVGAAMGVEQMKRLPGFLEKRERNFELLAEGLAEIDELTVLESGHDGERRSSHYALVAVLDEPLQDQREEIIDALKAAGVGTSVYYPKPLSETRFYRETYGYDQGSHPVAATISYGSIAFPVGPHIEEGDVETIVDTVKQVLAQVTVRG
ncbi:MAG TPA: DegT/DnrJ/EryC1/StrS family aminotransferase [Thermoleophilaceae bacterium]